MKLSSSPFTVLTGATAGLGIPLAVELARLGHRLVLGARSPTRGDAAVTAIRARVPDADVTVLDLDLSSLASIRAFAEDLGDEAIDRLVLNAAVMTIDRQTTANGFELMLGTNALGHFALVGALAPQLRASARARIVTQSSESHRPGRLDFDDLQMERSFNAIAAYNASKLAQHVLAVELDRRLESIESVVSQPGWVNSELGRDMFARGSALQRLGFRLGNALVGQDPAVGAQSPWKAATDEDAPGASTGRYCTPMGLRRLRGAPGWADADPKVLDEVVGQRLWDAAVALTGVDPTAADPKAPGVREAGG